MAMLFLFKLLRQKGYDRHFEICTGRPGYVYNFNTQNLLAFEENFKWKGDISLVAYIDFETRAATHECLDPENRKMFAVSYVIISAFYPELDTGHVIVECSFAYLRERLTILNYLM